MVINVSFGSLWNAWAPSPTRVHNALTPGGSSERARPAGQPDASCVSSEGGRTSGDDLTSFSQVLHYDYYGAYGNQAHEDYAYSRLLRDEYTFDFPPHHDVVSSGIRLPSLPHP